MSSQPLALAYHAHGQAAGLQGWRKGEDAIDALPYYDHMSDEEAQKAKLLIEQELAHSTKAPSDYLRDLPPEPVPRFEDYPALQQDLER